MIDPIVTTLVLGIAGLALVGCLSVTERRRTKARATVFVVAALGVVLLVVFDWWSIGSSDDLAREAEIGGQAQTFHQRTLMGIGLWSVLLAALSLLLGPANGGRTVGRTANVPR